MKVSACFAAGGSAPTLRATLAGAVSAASSIEGVTTSVPGGAALGTGTFTGPVCASAAPGGGTVAGSAVTGGAAGGGGGAPGAPGGTSAAAAA